jgi:DNA-binding IclR family transcriptional regulator
MQRPQGTTFHPYANASGLVLMAFLPQDEALALRERYPFYEFGAHLWGSVDAFSAYLDDVRELGYAVPPFPDQVGFRAAAPVHDARGTVLGAVGASVGGRSDADTVRLTERVVAAAGDITESLR